MIQSPVLAIEEKKIGPFFLLHDGDFLPSRLTPGAFSSFFVFLRRIFQSLRALRWLNSSFFRSYGERQGINRPERTDNIQIKILALS